MDNATNDLLRDIATLQKEQNELLKRYLWRLRFSLLTLLLITTATAVMLGLFGMRKNGVVPPSAIPSSSGGFLTVYPNSAPTVPPTPTPALERLWNPSFPTASESDQTGRNKDVNSPPLIGK